MKDKILITGGAGFIGKHLIEKLEDKKTIHVLDDMSAKGSSSIAGPTYHHIDMANQNAVTQFFEDEGKFEIVYHLASDSVIEKDNFESYRRNVDGTANMLEAMVKHGIQNMVYSSGGAVYGETMLSSSEGDALDPISLYGSSKVASESLIRTCAHKHSIKFWIFRFSTVVGSGMDHGVIHDFLHSYKEHGKIHIHGDGNQRSNFIHVDDVVKTLTNLEMIPVNTVYNLSSDDTTSVNEVATLIGSALKRHVEFVYLDPLKGHTQFNCPVNTKLRSVGWKPSMSSSQAVEKAARELAEEILKR
jgi:UDP-glucose 4-epimerase